MDMVRGDRTFERTILKYAAGVCLGMLLLVAYPAYVEITTRGDFAADRLETHSATVLNTDYDSGWDTSSNWTSQQITLRLDTGAERTKPRNEIMIRVDEGDTVSVGLSHGRLVSVQGTYVRSPSAVTAFGLLIMAGGLVLSAICAVQIRRSPSTRSTPYTSGYVLQALVLYLLLFLVTWPGRYEAWGPVINLVLATAIPLAIFGVRHRRPVPAVTP
ncbi:hypothetical protein [Actinoplanes awajinensis]|uniref:Uncharacterized protein n=1 Tax=Actinoplanes awajinensis subsp. mycoplanecinus TaxID=135947 RepID=A0A101JRR1_9ACTN|nr:hypothetical protein [Actinoplanes awajinensis]KUL31759.1 hypothetical protein ADL15_21540 [Actinoplanes awajinensis subsp. mycoplanecinus]